MNVIVQRLKRLVCGNPQIVGGRVRSGPSVFLENTGPGRWSLRTPARGLPGRHKIFERGLTV